MARKIPTKASGRSRAALDNSIVFVTAHRDLTGSFPFLPLPSYMAPHNCVPPTPSSSTTNIADKKSGEK
jgi:hypothetical protein